MTNGVWSTVVNSATAARAIARRWVLRPLVTVVASFAIAVVTAGYSLWTSVPQIWNSETWTE